MANLVMGALPSIIPKLYELLKEEFQLQTGAKERIRSLMFELDLAQAALGKVAEVPWDQLDKHVQIWARKVREASYDMEDVLDTFLVRVEGPESPEEKKSLQKYLKKMTNFFKKSKARRKISGDVKNIMSHLEEVTEQCRRYKVEDIAVAMPHTPSVVDPRLHAMYNKVEDLVGIDKSRDELISILQSPQRKGASNLKNKIVVIVGVGGLGKTTLAKAVYDNLQRDFKYTAFVPVGRKPNPQQVIQGILIQLDSEQYMKFNFAALQHISEFINELRKFLHEKRYFIVIDDLWEQESWETIKLAFDDNNCDSRIIITTRNREVSETGYEVYDLPQLPDDSSRELFFIRIGHEGKLIDNKQDEVTVKFLKKCAGIPLAIITMASLLVGKPMEKWDELYRSIGFGSEDNKQAQNTVRIVSFSYYDLPAHLRTCLLYLSAFPEDSIIPKDSLVWMWVAEGFVKKKQGMRLFETGEGYFHDLVNRSMIGAVKSHRDDSIVTGCRVHDMVLDFIRSMSDQENFLSIVLDNDQGSLLESNNVPRRLAHHNRTMGHGHCHSDDLNMAKVRSMFAISCGIEVSYPFHGFTLLRVLVIDCMATKGNFILRNEHVRNLLHLRFLSVRGTFVDSILEEIGHLRFLQVLDLKESFFKEWQSMESLPQKLLCLWLPIGADTSNYYDRKFWLPSISNDDIFSLTRLTSLEELSISVSFQQVISWRLPTELRVLKLCICGNSEATAERNFWECVRHLNRLEHLTISGNANNSMHVTDFILPGGLRHFAVGRALHFCKLPSCFSASCLSNLSHLDLTLQQLDEYDLKILGRLPELRFLRLVVYSSTPVSVVLVVSEKDAAVVYFPKLRCWELWNAMVSFHTNEEDKSISFHMWNEHGRCIGKPSVSEDKLQSSNISCSTCGPSGGLSSQASAVWVQQDKLQAATRDRFMPCLQLFRIAVSFSNWCDDDHHWDNIGFECCLPSLRKMNVCAVKKATEALRNAAEAHPNHPAFCVGSNFLQI